MASHPSDREAASILEGSYLDLQDRNQAFFRGRSYSFLLASFAAHEFSYAVTG